MRRFRVLCSALFALFVLGSVMVGSAVALPSILFLATGPGSLNGTNATTTTALQGEEGQLTGTGVELTLEANSRGLEGINLGTYLAFFKAVKHLTKNCATPGDPSGNVLIVGNLYHLVFDTLKGAAGTLGVAALFLVAQFLIDCEGFNLKIEGSALGLVHPINKEVQTTESLSGSLLCASTVASQGKPLESQYWDDAGNPQVAKLTVTVAGIKSEGCESVGNEVALKPSKAIEIMG